ncbi:MAG: nucleoside hydrolase [Anaerolineae bacterium]
MGKKLTRFILIVCLLSLMIFTVPAAAAEPRPVIIDTDMTTDDFMAILYVFNNPDFAVKAITVTGTGWSYCDAGVETALGLVALAGYADIPVSCWKDTPLKGGENPVPAEFRTSLQSIKVFNLPAGGKPAEIDAVALFTSTVEAAADKIEVLALGPLTNIAQAFIKKPALVDKIERITIMGGAVDVPGSGVSATNNLAEWNIYCDPPAARIVFESGAPITLVALDASNDVPVTMDFLKQLEADQKTPEAQFVFTALNNNSLDFIKSGYYFFWDPLAAAVLADPSIVTLTERKLTVVDREGADYGRTKAVGNGPIIMLATKPDGATFVQHLLDTWNAGA